MKHVDLAIALLLAAIFLFSGGDKIFHYQGFLNALMDYVLVPRGTSSLIAPVVIAVELCIGIGLLVRPWRRQAALVAAGTLAIFTTALVFNYLYGGRGICGCWFTITLAKSSELHLVQNLLLFGLSLSVWWEGSAHSAIPRASQLDS
ncbi:MAG: DoxX family membrane protein [Thermoanaerobaculia bacterium]|nr:DoxX family membrane protein [Thermoanaerobaculia bacterium]